MEPFLLRQRKGRAAVVERHLGPRHLGPPPSETLTASRRERPVEIFPLCRFLKHLPLLLPKLPDRVSRRPRRHAAKERKAWKLKQEVNRSDQSRTVQITAHRQRTSKQEVQGVVLLREAQPPDPQRQQWRRQRRKGWKGTVEDMAPQRRSQYPDPYSVEPGCIQGNSLNPRKHRHLRTTKRKALPQP